MSAEAGALHTLARRALVWIADEDGLSRRLRREAANLLVGEWGGAWRGDAYAGPHPPEFRVIEQSGSGSVVGHVSAFAIPTEPALALYGIGDLVVKPRYRREGVAARVIAAVVHECERRDADVMLVDTEAARRQFSSLGFRLADPWSFFYERNQACHRHPQWLTCWRTEPIRPVHLLAHGDF